MNMTDDILFLGVNDTDIDLFENQYVVPEGVSYNSYLIMDEKIAIMDTVDKRATDEWMNNVVEALDDKKPDYLVISHMEPDHGANIDTLLNKYPDVTIVGNAKTFQMINQFYNKDYPNKLVVKEGDKLNLGNHELTFIFAPMVHWPEVMMSYDSKDKVLFSADGFGKFGKYYDLEDWACEARRYYFNIVGKYGVQVQNVLKKASTLDIKMICPLHGPVLSENLEYYIDKYNVWSSYQAEDEGITIACSSIHGNTYKACMELKKLLEEKNQTVVLYDLSRSDEAEVIEDCFRYDRLVLATSTYDGGIFPTMVSLIHHLKAKNYQNRTIALIENGTWAAQGIRVMTTMLEGSKNIDILEEKVSIKSALNESSYNDLVKLADALCK